MTSQVTYIVGYFDKGCSLFACLHFERAFPHPDGGLAIEIDVSNYLRDSHSNPDKPK